MPGSTYEVSANPGAQWLAAEIASGIEHDWREFERLANLSAVQQYCAFEARYEDIWEDELNSDSVFDFDPVARTFSPEEVAAYLTGAYKRLDTYLEGILTSFCAQKRRQVPSADNVGEAGAILASVLTGGMEKVTKHLGAENLTDTRNSAYISSTLLLLAGRLASLQYYEQTAPGLLEADLLDAEINELVDARLQEACQLVRGDKRHETNRSMSDAQRIFAGCMNIMRAFYFRGRDKSFMNHLLKVHGPQWADTALLLSDLLPGDFPTLEAYDRAVERQAFERFAAAHNRLLGTTYAYPGPAEMHRLLLQTEAYAATLPNPDALRHAKRVEYLGIAIHSTRHFVDAIADGALKYSEIMQAMMQLRKQPLKAREVRELYIPYEELDWIILPPDEFDEDDRRVYHHSVTPQSGVGPRPPIDLDNRRLAKLRMRLRQWGGGYIAVASAKVEGLSRDRQYVVAVFPEYLPDGTKKENAMAAHPKYGNGLYLWRYESGDYVQTADGEALTWRKVFSCKRSIALELGARRLNNYDDQPERTERNVLDYLTCPPSQVRRAQFAVGESVVRIAGLARPASADDTEESLM